MFEVVDSRSGEGVQLRDARTGETFWALEKAGSEGLVAGELILARAPPDGDDLRVGGPLMRVPLRLRESVIALTGDPEADACDWAEWIGYAEAPPQLENREGETFVACSARYRITDPEAARAALAGALERDEAEDQFVEHVEVDGDRLIRGFVTVTGDEIELSTNSIERAERLKALVERLIDGAVLIDEIRDSVEDISRRAGPDPGPGEPVPPEAAEAVAEYLTDYARRWVDLPVPALGGMTPRQALDDPTRREDLLALLRDFERQEHLATPGVGGMPTAVARAELGLV